MSIQNAKRRSNKNVAKLPKLDPIVVDAVTDMLMTDQGMMRPPEKTAALLALIVELHKSNAPFPPRGQVAKHIGAMTDGYCSVYTIDKALSTRMAQDYLAEEWTITPGSIRAHDSITRSRRYVPAKRLIEEVERAKRVRENA